MLKVMKIMKNTMYSSHGDVFCTINMSTCHKSCDNQVNL